MRALGVAVCLVVVLGASGRAAAQEASDAEKATSHFGQGDAYFKAGSYKLAIEEYEKAYGYLSKPGFLFNIGLAYEKLGEKRKAVEHYRRYLAAEPEGRAAYEAKARAGKLEAELAEEGAAAAEREREEKDRERRAGEARAHRERAQSLESAGKLDEAVQELQSAYALTEDPELLWELGELHDRRSDPAAAIVEYERYRQVAPAGSHSGEAVQRVAANKASIERAASASEKRVARAYWSVQSRLGIANILVAETRSEWLSTNKLLVGRVSRTGWAVMGQVGYTFNGLEFGEDPVGRVGAVHLGLSLSHVGRGRLTLSPTLYVAAAYVSGEDTEGVRDSGVAFRGGGSADLRLAVSPSFDLALTLEVFGTPPAGTELQHIAAGAGLMLDFHGPRPVGRGVLVSGPTWLWLACAIEAVALVYLSQTIEGAGSEG